MPFGFAEKFGLMVGIVEFKVENGTVFFSGRKQQQENDLIPNLLREGVDQRQDDFLTFDAVFSSESLLLPPDAL